MKESFEACCHAIQRPVYGQHQRASQKASAQCRVSLCCHGGQALSQHRPCDAQTLLPGPSCHRSLCRACQWTEHRQLPPPDFCLQRLRTTWLMCIALYQQVSLSHARALSRSQGSGGLASNSANAMSLADMQDNCVHVAGQHTVRSALTRVSYELRWRTCMSISCSWSLSSS